MKKVVIAFAAAIVLLLACGGEEGVTPRAPDRVDPTSPVKVLENVEKSFNRRDVDLLKAMLSEDFVFYFNPRDVGQSPPWSQYIIPESWSYTEFWITVRNMLWKIRSIDLSITTSGVGSPGEAETTYRADNVKIWLLAMINEQEGVLVERGYCNFAFAEYTGKDGNKYWQLTEWRDRTYDWSLGTLLALFR